MRHRDRLRVPTGRGLLDFIERKEAAVQDAFRDRDDWRDEVLSTAKLADLD
ncbi:MAG: hypothetical protein SV760_06685 [Halobacteria archaeon]|nr:hypothetical protein [Halobacteria archaeon]